MDPVVYCQHIRRVLLNEAMSKIDAMEDAEVIDTAFERAQAVDPTLKRSAFEGALKEGMDPEEINSILDLDLDDPIDDINNVPQLDSTELEDLIVSSLDEVFDLFLDKPGASILMQYFYFDEDADGEPTKERRGNLIAYGQRSSLDLMLREMRKEVSSLTRNGFVDSSFMGPEEDDDEDR